MSKSEAPAWHDDPLVTVVEKAPCLLTYWDRHLVCSVANPAVQTWFGVDRTRLIGLSLPELLGPELFDLHEHHVRAALAGEPQRFERRMACPDGSVRHSVARLVPDVVDGEVRGFIAYITDITLVAQREVALREEIAEREHAASRLRGSEAALREAQRLGRLGSWEWEIEPDISTWSEELYRIFGRDPRLLPPAFAQHGALYTAQSWRELQAAVGHAIETGAPYQLELQYRHLDGTQGWLEARGEVVRDGDGRTVMLRGTAQVVTERRELCEARVRQVLQARERRQVQAQVMDAAAGRIREELKRRSAAEDALAKARQLALIGQLTSGVAHDFNNVLAGIAGAFHLLYRTVTDPAQRDWVRRGSRSVERGARVVRQLMRFASTQSDEPELLNIAETVASCSDMLSAALGPRVPLKIEASCEWQAVADPRLLEVALLNLAINARDAMPGGGQFMLRCFDVELHASEHPVGLEGEFVAICATDTGAGMAPEVLARVREPFFTTKPLGAGTGLGLPMVDAFAAQAGGRFTLSSQPGQGTQATLYLPRAGTVAGPVSRAEPVPAKAAIPQGHGGATILVVDDDPLVRPAAAQYLRDLGYAVVEAEDALHALALADAPDAFDLVLTDVVMPLFDGVALVDRLRAKRPNLPVLLMTGYSDRSRLAGEEVLDKPFTQDELAQRVLKLLGRMPKADTLAARFRSPSMRALYARWLAARGDGDTLPTQAAMALDQCADSDSIFVAEVMSLSPFSFRRTRVGTSLQNAAGAAALAADAPIEEVADEPFIGLEAAYLRCARLREPSYEYLRFRQGSGAATLFERLLLPCADATGRNTLLIGMVMIQNPPSPHTPR